MSIPTGWELILLLGVLVLLFGSTKLPTAARSIGQSLRIFKAETKGMRSENKDAAPDDEQASQPPVTQPPVTQAPVSQPPVSQPPAAAQQALPPSGSPVSRQAEESRRSTDPSH